ncbi:MAG: hypothetical protein JG718_06445 [Candidatus Thiothrix moscowensis]|nr:hypothetical protein [Candidatus Thiothrix moscowensis]
MNAIISMGTHAPNPLQALARLLPSGKPSHPRPQQPVIRRKNRKVHVSALVYKANETGFIAYLHGVPVAWVLHGYHQGQQDHQPKQCRFVDVAYHRQTAHGVNLETADFDTLQQAFDFLQAVFGGKGGAA